MGDEAREHDEQDTVEDLELHDQSADKVTGGTPSAGTSNNAAAAQSAASAVDSYARG